jgi:hypothetical protein
VIAAWLGMAALVAWLSGRLLGPMLGCASFARMIEIREGRVFLGEGLPALQALRRQHWLGRFFARLIAVITGTFSPSPAQPRGPSAVQVGAFAVVGGVRD